MSGQELQLAVQLVEQSCSERFEPMDYIDPAKQRILDAAQRKLSGGAVFDTATIISQLMQLEAAPQTRLQSRLTSEKSTLSILQGINSKLSALMNRAKDLGQTSDWSPFTVESSSTLVTTGRGWAPIAQMVLMSAARPPAPLGSLALKLSTHAGPRADSSTGCWVLGVGRSGRWAMKMFQKMASREKVASGLQACGKLADNPWVDGPRSVRSST